MATIKHACEMNDVILNWKKLKKFIKSEKTDNKLITTADIADNAVTSPKIKDGEVKTSDIEDGTITGDDVSPAFMVRKTLLDDAAGHSHGWNPDGIQTAFLIYDIDVDESDSTFVSIMLNGLGGVCSIHDVITGGFRIACSGNAQPVAAPQDGGQLDYIIFKLPPHVVTSSASVSPSSTSSSTSPSTPIISSPFSSLGDINPK